MTPGLDYAIQVIKFNFKHWLFVKPQRLDHWNSKSYPNGKQIWLCYETNVKFYLLRLCLLNHLFILYHILELKGGFLNLLINTYCLSTHGAYLKNSPTPSFVWDDFQCPNL